MCNLILFLVASDSTEVIQDLAHTKLNLCSQPFRSVEVLKSGDLFVRDLARDGNRWQLSFSGPIIFLWEDMRLGMSAGPWLTWGKRAFITP